MNIQIQNKGFDLEKDLLALISSKVKKLAEFNNQIIKVTVFLNSDNIAHEVKDKVTKICVHIPGHSFFKQSTSKKSFEESFANALKAIILKINSKKEKLRKINRQLTAA